VNPGDSFERHKPVLVFLAYVALAVVSYLNQSGA
jgi:hypothetical protein